MGFKPNYYETLQVDRKATLGILYAAYNEIMDKCGDDEERTAAVTEAFKILSDPQMRWQYDAWLGEPQTPALITIESLLEEARELNSKATLKQEIPLTDASPFNPWYRKIPVIPIILLVLLVAAWGFRWDIEASKTGNTTVRKWVKDQWTGQVWLRTYDNYGYTERLVGAHHSHRDTATAVWCVLFISILGYTVFKVTRSGGREDGRSPKNHGYGSSPGGHAPPASSDFRPWPRLWAKVIDIGVYRIIVGSLILFMIKQFWGISFSIDIYSISITSWKEYLIKNLLIEYLLLFTYPSLEALMLYKWGTSFGKWLFGIKTVDENGNNLSYGTALKREYNVLFQGLGLAIPILNVILAYISAKKLKNDGNTSWDAKFNALTCYQEDNAIKKITAYILLIPLFCFSYAPNNIKDLNVNDLLVLCLNSYSFIVSLALFIIIMRFIRQEDFFEGSGFKLFIRLLVWSIVSWLAYQIGYTAALFYNATQLEALTVGYVFLIFAAIFYAIIQLIKKRIKRNETPVIRRDTFT